MKKYPNLHDKNVLRISMCIIVMILPIYELNVHPFQSTAISIHVVEHGQKNFVKDKQYKKINKYFLLYLSYKLYDII